MGKGLERLNNKNLPCSNCKELKALEIIKPLFRLKGNCLQIYCPFANNDDKYMFVKELETKEEYDILKEVLPCKV